MYPLAPVQRRSLEKLKTGRAIVVSRVSASAPVPVERSTPTSVADKRISGDRRQQQLPVDQDRRKGDRRGRRGRPNARLSALLSNSDQPPPPRAGTLVDETV